MKLAAILSFVAVLFFTTGCGPSTVETTPEEEVSTDAPSQEELDAMKANQ